MARASDTLTNREPKGGTTGQKRTPVKMGDVLVPRTDKPEYVKGEELERIFPFTIFSVSGPMKSRFNEGRRYNFGVAWKEGDITVKKVLTLSENEDRTDIAFNVRKHGAITNCRLYQIQLGGEYTYWKIWDADAQPPDNVIGGEREARLLADDDIPF